VRESDGSHGTRRDELVIAFVVASYAERRSTGR
jgi:hypothetical protein